MARVDHVAMYVHDLESAKIFFEKYFGAKSNELYNNAATGFKSYFLSFDDESRIELMSRKEIADTENSIYRAGYVHIAFSVGGKDNVDRLTTELVAAGYELLSGPRTTGDGYYESCIVAFENNMIEITE